MTIPGRMGDEDQWRNLPYIAAWAGVFLVAVAAYWPGLSGPFVLDDFGSIAALGDRGGVVDWETFKAFVFGGATGPTGRPISLLSFLIDANNWPADPWPFKRSNLVIHLLNGSLLGLVTYRILRTVNYADSDAKWIAAFSVAFWLLHPFLISTTLYVVQRMTQLSTLFVLAGLATYIHGRSLLAAAPMRAYLAMSAAIGFATLLAVFSKENGILLPLLIGILELTIFASQRPRIPDINRFWRAAFIVLPALVVAVYVGERVTRDTFFEIVPPRDFSIYERMLTQPRILVDYLQNWFFPKLYTTGVFQDHFLKSTNLLTPVTTLIAILFHAATIAFALVNRRRWPIVAFAILFFYGGHILESTVINLELYFEHRNYLPAAFLFLPVAVLARRKLRPGTYFLAMVFVVLAMAGFTRYSASIWASFPSIVEASARKAPTSARAQAQYSLILFKADRHAEALQVIDQAIENSPTFKPLLNVNRLVTLCDMGQLQAAEFDTEARELSQVPYDVRLIRVYSALAGLVVAGRCPEIAATQLSVMFTRMLEVPRNADPTSLEYSQIKYLIGFSYAHARQRQKAAAAFEDSLEAQPGASHAMLMAAVLATNEFAAEALHFSDQALSQLDEQGISPFRGSRVSEADIRAFQATVRADLDALQDADIPRSD